jgi:hypothetical protein
LGIADERIGRAKRDGYRATKRHPPIYPSVPHGESHSKAPGKPAQLLRNGLAPAQADILRFGICPALMCGPPVGDTAMATVL